MLTRLAGTRYRYGICEHHSPAVGDPSSNPGSGTCFIPANKHFSEREKCLWGQVWGQVAIEVAVRDRKEQVASRADFRPGLGRLASVTGSSDATAQGERERNRLRPPAGGGRSMNYARRQQYRRLARAGNAGLGSVIAGLLGLMSASVGAAALAGLLLLTAVGLGLYARHWLSLAGRSRVGANSEDEVQRTLSPLRAEGWRLRHSLPWQGQGDIDSVAIAPTGIAVAIETKTRTYERRHLARVHDQAAWLARRRRRRARSGALGVVCLVGARGVERVEHDVLVVSVDRLIDVLRVAAGSARKRPSSG